MKPASASTTAFAAILLGACASGQNPDMQMPADFAAPAVRDLSAIPDLAQAPPDLATDDGPTSLKGRMAWWRAEGNTKDSAGAYDGTAEGSVTYAAGHAGQAFSLPGASVDVAVPDGIIGATARNYSIAAWVWLDPTALDMKQHWIFYGGNKGGELSLTVNSNNLTDFSVHGADGTWYGAYSSKAPVTGAWMLVVGTRRNDALELWIDGAMAGSAGIPANVDSLVDKTANATSSSIGGWGRNKSDWWKGRLDEVQIFDHALSKEEIQSL